MNTQGTLPNGNFTTQPPPPAITQPTQQATAPRNQTEAATQISNTLSTTEGLDKIYTQFTMPVMLQYDQHYHQFLISIDETFEMLKTELETFLALDRDITLRVYFEEGHQNRWGPVRLSDDNVHAMLSILKARGVVDYVEVRIAL